MNTLKTKQEHRRNTLKIIYEHIENKTRTQKEYVENIYEHIEALCYYFNIKYFISLLPQYLCNNFLNMMLSCQTSLTMCFKNTIIIAKIKVK